MNPPYRVEQLVDQVIGDTPDASALERLARSVIQAEQLTVLGDQLVGHFVDEARQAGASWTEIGSALGVSKQAVQKRFVSRRVPGDSKALFTRFDDEARAVVVEAMELARDGRHGQVNTGHIVLALLADDDGRAACLLRSIGVPTEVIRADIIEALGPGQEDMPEHLPWAPDAKKVLELSLREAFRRQAGMIGPEHILLGLVRDTTSLGGKTLAKHGADRRRLSDSAG
jgi:hypothetical protein